MIKGVMKMLTGGSLVALAFGVTAAPAWAQNSAAIPVQSGTDQAAPRTPAGDAAPGATGTPGNPDAPAAPRNEPTPSNSYGDIVVTATRGAAQNLQTVPLAVSAIQSESLTTRGINNIADIVKTVPSVNIVERGPGQSQVTIRGISSGAFSITETGDRPLVSVYLDDVPISIQGANPDLKVFDLERVEILRGPQGTLFGSGSMAGTIRYITIKPSTSGFSGSTEGVVSGTDSAGQPNWNLRGKLNIPLASDLAMLVSGYVGRDAGFVDNVGIGKKDVNYAATQQVRGAIRWTGVPDLTVDASVLYARLRTGGLPVGYTGLPRYTYRSQAPEYYRDSFLVANLTGEYKLGAGTLISSTSYVDRSFTSATSGFTYEYINQTLFNPPKLVSSQGIPSQKVHTFTEELRYLSDPDQPLSVSLGAFYEHTTRDYVQNNYVPGLDASVGLRSVEDLGTPFENDLFYGVQHIRERQFAVFGEAKYKFSDTFDVSAGVRYFNFLQSFNLSFAGLAGSAFQPNPSPTGPTFLPLTQSGRPKADGFNPRFIASYKPSTQAMVFAEVSKGFRYGSVNEPVASAFCNGLTGPTTVGPDHLWNYALGFKSQTADRHLTFNVTGFFVDWQDVQSRVDLSCGYYYRVNQGHVQSKGVELETVLRPFQHFTLSLNGSYTDASAKQTVFVPSGGIVAADGDRAPLFPRWIAALSGLYVIPIRGNELTLSSDLQYRSNFYNRFDPGNPNYRETPDQTLLNASVTYSFGQYELGLFGTNLNNSENLGLVDAIRTRPNALVPPYAVKFYGRPRTVGLRAKVKF